MIVRCVRIFNEREEEVESWGDFLLRGNEYVVLEIYGRSGNWSGLRLIDETGKPSVHSSGQFELVSDRVPRNWVVSFLGERDRSTPGSILLAPASWRGTFWEDYFKGHPKARDAFERELAILNSEA
jgi:hypothetical protein